MAQMGFAESGVLAALTDADSDTLNELPFGVVKMDLDGTVLEYNHAEAKLSGLSRENVIGRNFFTQVAPCTNNFMVAERYHQNDTLDETIDYVFTYRMRPTEVRLRMLKDATRAAQFLLVERL